MSGLPHRQSPAEYPGHDGRITNLTLSNLISLCELHAIKPNRNKTRALHSPELLENDPSFPQLTFFPSTSILMPEIYPAVVLGGKNGCGCLL